MKKRIGIILLLFSLILAVYLVCFLGNPVRLSEISVNDRQLEQIMENRRMSEEKLLEKLFFDEQQLLFDTTENTFYYSLVEGSSSAYDPYVELRAAEGVSIAAVNAQITSEDIRAGRTYQIIAYDDTSYRLYQLRCSTLPLMNIECDAAIDAEDVSMHMTLFDNRKGAAQKYTESDGMVHVRGGSTRAYPKKSYKISLTKKSLGDNSRLNKLSLLGMRQDDDWILYAGYNDQEKIRNVFSTNLWKASCAKDNSLGIDNGMEYQYIELFINGSYWGLYALGYPIDDLQLGVDTSEGERLYKKFSWDSEALILSTPDVGVTGYETDETGEDDWALLKQYYTTLHTEWTNAERMYAGIDIDNAIDMYLFINLIQGLDHVGALDSLSIKNMFFSFHNTGGREIVLYTPWDMDITWGNEWTGDSETNLINPYGIESSQNTILELGNLQALILNGDENIWGLIFSKYWSLRETLWSEQALDEMLDEYEEDIYLSGAYRREQSRWPEGTYSDAEKGLDAFRSYVKERLKETDDYYRRLEHLISERSASDNIFILRSAQHKDFLKSNFIIEISDHSLLSDDDYKEFLEYIGIDTDQIAEDIHFIVVDGSEQKVEYLETLSVQWFEEAENATPGISVVFENDGVKTSFDFSKEYVMWSCMIENQDATPWCDRIKDNGYDIVIEIVNHEVIYQERFCALLKNFGVNEQSLSEQTDFIVIQNGGEAATILDNSHGSGSRCDTVLGTLSVFYNEEGGYGVYLNNGDCMTASPEDNRNVDIRVAVVSGQTGEVIWCPTFSYS